MIMITYDECCIFRKANHSSGSGSLSPLQIRLKMDTPKKSKQKPSLRTFLRLKKDKQPSNNCSSLVLSSSGFSNPGPGRHHLATSPYRLPSDPSIPSSYAAVTVLDRKGHNKTLLQKRGSSGNVMGVSIPQNTCRAASNTSMDSGKSINTNTISNSSLQDMDEGEYTSEELAGQMAEINLNLESPKNIQI